jgi:Transcriptional regulator, AbiEi antitoxin
MRPQLRTVDATLALLATRSHGLVTRSDLLATGLSHDQIKSRLRRGSLIAVHRGVYRVGHRAPSDESHYLAAVLACGKGALLSGLAAANLLGLVKGVTPAPEVSAPTERRVQGVTTRRMRYGDAPAGIVCRGVPVTPVPLTLVDLAGRLDEAALARACHEAGVRYGTTPADVAALLERRPNTPGARQLRRILDGDVPVSLSRLESRFFARLREGGLPRPPHTNRDVGGRRVDCRWPEQRLTVELDSYRYHSSRYAWERDRRREREAYARGDDFRRYTYDDVFVSPTLMLRELQGLLLQSPS